MLFDAGVTTPRIPTERDPSTPSLRSVARDDTGGTLRSGRKRRTRVHRFRDNQRRVERGAAPAFRNRPDPAELVDRDNRSARSRKARIVASDRLISPVGTTRITTTPCGSNPSRTDSSRRTLWTRSPAPVKRISANAIDAAAVASRTGWRSDARPPRPNAPCGDWRDANIAGARPASAPQIRTVATLSASTRPSTRTWSASGMAPGGAKRNSTRTPPHASGTPAAAPAIDRHKLSMRACRISRQRLAPSAARIARSCVRDIVRIRISPAALEHAIARRSAPAAANNISGCRALLLSSGESDGGVRKISRSGST
jgi:hypothetical protein